MPQHCLLPGLAAYARVQEENSGTLRRLMMEYLSAPPDQSRRRNASEQKYGLYTASRVPASPCARRFWNALATPEVLAASRPPDDLYAPPRPAASAPTLRLICGRADLLLCALRAPRSPILKPHPMHVSELDKTRAQVRWRPRDPPATAASCLSRLRSCAKRWRIGRRCSGR